MKKLTLLMTLVFSYTTTINSFAMSLGESIEATTEDEIVEETSDVGNTYNAAYASIDQMSDEQFSEALNETGSTLLQYAKDYPEKDGKEELELLGNTYIDLSKDKESKHKVLKFLGNVGSKGGIGALKGLTYVAGDGANILYNIVSFPNLIVKDLIKVIVMHKTKDDLITGKIKARVTVLIASTLINWGFPPKVKDQDYDANFNPKKVGMILAKRAVTTPIKQVGKSILESSFDNFGNNSWDAYISAPVKQATKINGMVDVVLPNAAPVVGVIAISLGVMNMVANTTCLVSEAHTKELSDRTKAGAVVEKMCNRMKRQNLAFEKPAASIASFLGKPLSKLLKRDKSKKKSKKSKQVVPEESV